MNKLLTIILFMACLNQSQIVYGQLSQEEIDKIIHKKVWCITDIKVDGESKGADGKWLFISEMNMIVGEDERIDKVIDLLNKKYIENGLLITYLDDRTESLVKTKFIVNKNKKHPDSNEYSYEPNTYVGLIGKMNIDNVKITLQLICTSVAYGESSLKKLPPKNWNGN